MVFLSDIDFGHFLGNFKQKFGVKRERSPFVFTPQYAQVLDGRKSPLFKNFVNVCCHAYNILRKHSTLFIDLFLMVFYTHPECYSMNSFPCRCFRLAFLSYRMKKIFFI